MLTGVAVAAFAGATALVTTTTAGAEQSKIDWWACDDAEGVRCASIEVPMDWSKPDGPTIEVGLAKRPASDPDARVGTILMDPGGPGGSGVDVVKHRQNPLTKKATRHFDLVGFDPRGVNSTEPVKCDEGLTGKATAAARVDSEAGFKEPVTLNKDLYEDCKQRSGDIVDHADPLRTVEDIEGIRKALGEGKLNYLGFSYGALMGQQYAEKYPDQIRTMVLDGNMDHSISNTWEFMRTETAPVEENFLAFAKWCESTEECSLCGQDVKAVYADLKKKAREGTLTDPQTGDKVNFFGLSDLTFNANDPASWKDLAATYRVMATGQGGVSVKAVSAAETNFVTQAAFCADY